MEGSMCGLYLIAIHGDSVLFANNAVVLFQLARSSEALTLSAAVLASYPRNGRLLTARGGISGPERAS